MVGVPQAEVGVTARPERAYAGRARQEAENERGRRPARDGGRRTGRIRYRRLPAQSRQNHLQHAVADYTGTVMK